jgi:DNA polymerase-3 subunit delta'
MNNNLPSWLQRHINIFDNEEIHHAFIISGSKGIGKSILIESLAEKILNNKISLENNPDFHNLRILDEKKLIGINQIHELRDKLYESSFLGKNKVAVINEIEKISIDGLNAILKILEEPPKNTYFLLSTNFLNQIPLTIQSRCFDLRISSPEIQQSLEWLSDYQTKDALQALEITNNLPIKAKYFLDNNLLDARYNFVKDVSDIIKEGKDIVSISEKWINDNDTLNLKLEWMSQILSDSIKFHADKSIESLTSDTDAISKYLSGAVTPEKIHKLISKTNSLWNLFSRETNLRKDYQLGALFIDWEKFLGVSKKV